MDLLNLPRLDKEKIRKFADRAAKSYDHAAILQKEVLNRLLQRLLWIRHRPATVVDLGCGTGGAIRALQRTYPRARVIGLDLSPGMLVEARKRFRAWSRRRLVAGDLERLPFADARFDLVFSSLALPWCNDLPAALREFARIARPGALLLFSSYGPDTLRELAAAWAVHDRYPHVHRFVDMHDVGDAMLAAGFEQPVVDAETLRVEYDDLRTLLKDLRGAGASNADVGRRRGLTTPAQFDRLEAGYRERGFEDGKFVATYEIVYGHAWAASERGS